MPIDGKVRCIDHCIAQIVAALNAGGVHTVSSCCGHGEIKGCIGLEDGRVLIILPETPKDIDEWREAVRFISENPSSTAAWAGRFVVPAG